MRLLALFVALIALSPVAFADTVVLKDGNTLYGKIGQVTADSLKFHSESIGDVTLKLDNVTSYKLDTPAHVRLKDAAPITAAVSGEGKQIKIDDQKYTFDQVKSINPPAEAWSGHLLANFSLARGNTNNFTAGIDAAAGLRRDNFWNDDRFTFTGQYNYSQSGGGAGNDNFQTDTDNWTLFGKYDRFWTEKLYGYASGKLEHDRIAGLYYRVSPNVGLGYQWIEDPKTNFFTEAGVGYVGEQYDDDSSNDYMSLRFAYHIEHAFNDDMSVFHNTEYVPAINDPGDYTLTSDAGVKVKLYKNFIGQAKVQYKRDSTPAEGSLKNDLLYLIGVGWQF